MNQAIPIEFREERKVIPNHLKWTWIFFPFFLIDFIIEELNLKLASLIRDPKIKTKSNIIELTTLRKNGYSIVNQFLNHDQVDKLNELLFKERKLFYSRSSIQKKELEGSIRYRYLEAPSNAAKDIVKYNELLKIYSNYSLKRPKVSWMESFTKALNEDQLIFAGHPHIDSYRHQLKFVIAMENVTIQNGPTEYLGGTQQFNIDILLSYFLTWIYEKRIVRGKKQFLPKKIIKYYNSKQKELITMKKGDLSIFDSRGIHRGSEIKKGERHLLWFYFD